MAYWFGVNYFDKELSGNTYSRIYTFNVADKWDELVREALGVYDAGYYERAFELFLEVANQITGYNRSYAQTMAEACLAQLYYWGRGVEQNYQMAANYYLKVADLGSTPELKTDAQYTLGILYREGRGVPKDDFRAESYFKAAKPGLEAAAEAGDDVSQFRLGYMYEEGLGGLPKDAIRAHYWYRMAAEQGNGDAQESLDRIDGRR